MSSLLCCVKKEIALHKKDFLNTQSNTFLHATVNAVGSSSFLFHRVHKCEYQKSKADWRACINEGCDARARSIHLVIF
jgi:hypothetical protein